MISIAFKSDYNFADLTKVSIISEADSFIYALFQNNVIVESGRFPIEDYKSFLNIFEGVNIDFHYASKSNSFTHIDSQNLHLVKNKTSFHQIFNLDPKIYVCFNDELFLNNQDDVNHFSYLIHKWIKYRNDFVAYVHMGKTSMIICVSGLNGFKFYNEFEIENSDDIIYYLKAVFRELELNEDLVHILLSGYIEKDSEFHKEIYKYFKNVDFCHIENFTSNNPEINIHAYFDHFLNVNAK